MHSYNYHLRSVSTSLASDMASYPDEKYADPVKKKQTSEEIPSSTQKWLKSDSGIERVQRFATLLNAEKSAHSHEFNREYLSYLDQWVKAGTSIDGDRATGARRIKAWLKKIIFNTDQLLDLSELNLSSLPELPARLEHLDISFNKLCSLEKCPPFLKTFIAVGNTISHLESLSESLTVIDISRNEISALPNLPKNLIHLNIAINRIEELPEKIFDCTKLRLLDFSENKISQWQPWQRTLQRLCQEKHALIKNTIELEIDQINAAIQDEMHMLLNEKPRDYLNTIASLSKTFDIHKKEISFKYHRELTKDFLGMNGIDVSVLDSFWATAPSMGNPKKNLIS